MAKRVLRIQRSMTKDSYLGLPLLFGRSKAKRLRNIGEKVWTRIQNWGGRLLAQAGKAVMIQAIGQAIPVYAMSCFKLLRGFLHELNMLLAAFW